MKSEALLAEISRDFFKLNHVYRYRMKRITDMTDAELIHACHCYCEESNLINEFNTFRIKGEASYHYCNYLQEYICTDLCMEVQLIATGFMKASALKDRAVEEEAAKKYCASCKYNMWK